MPIGSYDMKFCRISWAKLDPTSSAGSLLYTTLSAGSARWHWPQSSPHKWAVGLIPWLVRNMIFTLNGWKPALLGPLSQSLSYACIKHTNYAKGLCQLDVSIRQESPSNETFYCLRGNATDVAADTTSWYFKNNSYIRFQGGKWRLFDKHELFSHDTNRTMAEFSLTSKSIF